MAKQLLSEFADIQALEKQKTQVLTMLNDVYKSLKDLQSMGVTIGGNAKDIDTLKKARTEIDLYEQSEKKAIEATKQLTFAQTEAYKLTQQITQATKEQQKQAQLQAQMTNEQVGAYKRLEAEAQLATIAFKNLAAAKGVDAKETQEAAIKSAELNQKLKDIDAVVGQNQRNVGNYSEATRGMIEELRNANSQLNILKLSGKENSQQFIDLKQKADTISNSLEGMGLNMKEALGTATSMRQEIRQLTQVLAQMEAKGEGNSQEFKTMVMRLGELKDAMGDTQNKAKFWADDARWVNSSVQAMQGLIGAYSAFNGVLALTGNQNEDLQKSMQKMQALMSIMMGVQQVSNMLQKDSMVISAANVITEKFKAFQLSVTTRAMVANTIATETSTVAAKANAFAWNAASKAMKTVPFLLIVTAVIAAAAALIKYGTALSDLVKKENEQLGVIQESRKAISDQSVSLQNLVAVAKNVNRTDADRLEALKEIEKQTNGQIKINDLSAASLKKLDDQTQIYIKSLIQQANVQAAESKMQEIAKANIDAQFEILKITNEINDKTGAFGFKLAASLTPLEAIKLGFTTVSQLISSIANDEQLQEKTFQNLIDLRTKDLRNTIEQNNKLKEGLGLYVATYKEIGKTSSSTDKMTKSTKDSKNELKEFDDVIKVTTEDLFGVSMTWEEWVSKIIDGTIPDVIDNMDELNVSISHVDESLKEMSNRNTFGNWLKNNQRLVKDFGTILDSTVTKTFSTISAYMEVESSNMMSKITKGYDINMTSIQSLLDNGIISQEEYDARAARLAREKEKREKEERRRFAKQQRDLQLFQATINTAAAVTMQLATGIGAEAIAAAITAGLLGAVEIAYIAAQPLPTFYKGTKNAPEGDAVVGERGFEYIEKRSGELFKTPNRSTITHLDKGDRVYTHSESIDIEKMLKADRYVGTTTNNNDVQLVGKIDELISTTKNKPAANITIDKHGIAFMVANGSSVTNYINNHIKYKR